MYKVIKYTTDPLHSVASKKFNTILSSEITSFRQTHKGKTIKLKKDDLIPDCDLQTQQINIVYTIEGILKHDKNLKCGDIIPNPSRELQVRVAYSGSWVDGGEGIILDYKNGNVYIIGDSYYFLPPQREINEDNFILQGYPNFKEPEIK